MPRMRYVKPEARRSLTMAEWTREQRLGWIWLSMYLDDHGYGVDDMRLIVAECFPTDRDMTEKKMEAWINLYATSKSDEDDIPPLCRFEVRGRNYLHAVKFHVHQKINRPQPSRFPGCPTHRDDHGCSHCPETGGVQ